ncbi:MAG: threonine synthase [Anaerolineae bacterium]|nr:threonine synthase [Anaerolineae bacterium]NIN97104.1 threonine synthase [Anaerolineae bacterium]NIQ80068.1 threonine synthase [Anaerolineae bacterium]
MDHILRLKCVICGGEYGADEVLYVCPKHGDEGILDVLYDYDLIATRLTKEGLARNHDYSIWRYAPLLPIAEESPRPPLHIGWTPLYHAQRLAEKLGPRHLYLKDDGRNPTASFKDRASAVGVVKAQELGYQIITAASTGNAASSLAGLAASVGLESIIFVPERAPKAKVAQLLIFGARVMMVKGTYDQAFDLCLEAAREYGWYSRNTAYNPYLSEGKKTAALELCEQLEWEAPDRIFVSVGDGCIIGGLWKGLRDLRALGFIERIPQLVGVQAEGSAPLVRAWEEGTEEIVPLVPDTLADSIAVGNPRDGVKALRAVRESGGQYVAVKDEEIMEAMRLLGREAAIFAEPAGAAGFAGLLKLVREGEIDFEERIAVLVTGSGLKDVDSAIRAVGEPELIEATMDALSRQLTRRSGP